VKVYSKSGNCHSRFNDGYSCPENSKASTVLSVQYTCTTILEWVNTFRSDTELLFGRKAEKSSSDMLGKFLRMSFLNFFLWKKKAA